MRYVSCLLLIFCISMPSYAFLRQRFSSNGVELFWNTNNLTIHANLSNSTALSEAQIESILDSTLSEWNGESRLTITKSIVSSDPSSSRNDFYFSNDASYFGNFPAFSSVLAVTVSRGVLATGEIVESDVIINNSKTYNNEAPPLADRENDGTNPVSGSYYLGDVVTHEFGHFVGLSHSQVKEATMLFTVFRGENTISEDDKSGVNTLFPDGTRSGKINGKVVGGTTSSPIGVFGAHVQAISSDSGKVVSSTFSDTDGTFSITGLPTGDTYYLYISPGNVISKNNPSGSPLPFYYTSATSNYCSGGADYEGAFYQGCNASRDGYAEGVAVSNSTAIELGSITIRCSTPTVAEGSLDDIVQNISSEVGESFVFNLDTTLTYSMDLNGIDTSSGDKLRVNVVANSLQLPTRFLLQVENNGNTFTKVYDDFDGDGNKENGIVLEDDNLITDVQFDVDLSSLDVSQAVNIKITPVDLDEDLNVLFVNDWLFPPSALLKGDTSYGLAIVKIVDSSGATIMRRTYTNPNNLSCVEGENTTSESSNLSSSSSTSSSSSGSGSSAGVACGTILLENGDDQSGGSGPFALVTLMFASFLFVYRRKLAVSQSFVRY